MKLLYILVVDNYYLIIDIIFTYTLVTFFYIHPTKLIPITKSQTFYKSKLKLMKMNAQIDISTVYVINNK